MSDAREEAKVAVMSSIESDARRGDALKAKWLAIAESADESPRFKQVALSALHAHNASDMPAR